MLNSKADEPTHSQLSDQDKKPESHVEHSTEYSSSIPDDLELIVTIKLGNLTKVINDIENQEHTVYVKVEEAVLNKERTMLCLLEEKFTEYHNLLDKKKKEVTDRLTSHFKHLRETVIQRHNPDNGLNEAKAKAIEWKNMVKKKMDTWAVLKTMETANHIIEEDESAMRPEINSWTKRIQDLMAAENIDILVDKSFLVFNEEELAKVVNSVCEHKALLEESFFEKIMKGNSGKNLATGKDIKSELEKEAITQRQSMLEKVFKAFSFETDIGSQGADSLKLTPSHSILSSTSPSKMKQEGGKLSSITVLKLQCTDFKLKSVSSFSDSLQLFSSLKELHITLDFCEKLTDNCLEVLGSSLSKLSNLQAFTIGLHSDCSKLNGTGFHSLIENISRLDTISQLSFMLGSFPTIKETVFCESLSLLSDLPNLTSLKLVLPSNPIITDNGIFKIANMLRKTQQLSTLELYLTTDNQLTDQGFARLCESIASLIGLTSLKIIIRDHASSISDLSFSTLVKAIKKLSVLNCLSLALPEARITNEAFTDLAIVLSQIVFLKELNLNFAWSHINDIGVGEFGRSISKLMYLEDLSLNFKACSITNEGFSDLAREVTKLFNLSKLELDMSWCKSVTDEGLIYFGELVQKMRGLSRFILRFEESKKITEDGMIRLCLELAGLEALEHLQIYLVKCGRDLKEEGSREKLEKALLSKRKNFIKNIWIVS